VTEALNSAFMAADSQLNADNDIFSGCTAVACLFVPKGHGDELTLYSANCGDSRSILWYKYFFFLVEMEKQLDSLMTTKALIPLKNKE
jgi:serine/threonine protein phosphatase PrpC